MTVKLLIFLISVNSLVSLNLQGQILFQAETEFEATNTPSKPVYLDFYTDWCAPCKRMDKEVFADTVVAHFYNEHFISFKINAESVLGKTIAKAYHVKVYPTSIFLNENLAIISRHEGYMNRDLFLQRGKTVLTNKTPVSYKNLDIDSLFLEITRLEELGLDNTLLVSEFFNSLHQDDYKKEKYLDLLYSKIVFLDTDNRGYRHFIDNLDLYKIDTIRSETLLFPSDITLRSSSIAKFDSKFYSALSRSPDLKLRLAEENKNSILFDSMLAAKQNLFEKIYKKQFSITQSRAICKRRLQFYLALPLSDSTQTIAHEFINRRNPGKHYSA